MQHVPITVFGGPTVLIEYGGLRFLTDPTFDGPGDYELPGGLVLTKTAPAPITPEELGPVDAVLLSHDQHADNLDTAGRGFLAGVPLTLSTHDGAQRLGGTVRGLSPWASVALPRPDGGTVIVTGTPALHGPEGAEAIAGEVIGFVLTADDLPTVYISGDNASLDVVRQIAERLGPVDSAVLFAGAPRLPVFDGALVVLDGAGAAAAARILGARRVVPAHCDSWAHFTEGRDDLVQAFASAGIADRLHI
ncbi:MBL fold metallo-hydrolase [Actinacidiphila glaucinigra]|uniref:L-ascorbate metabolism protein UlaG, beta-lactamase superfamily n=1 Tax=Actinacidiphila glaucinigra TaxID=235986 RepID=A0A239JQ56_9ACTN|nr:MBL fold metallo-hydrolase [Actinacidiphila glaucinigra]SNT06914.1 L-ascorbate metabolism protein UlaG, beta-lactamase superfamily [Actinacidiphila glaucinigra]